MPSFAAWPGTIPAGSKNLTTSQFHDWLPTFCELAGVAAPARTDGVSLVPVLRNPTAKLTRTPISYIEYTNNGRTPNWKDFKNHGGTTRKQAQAIFLDGYKGIRNNPKDHKVDFEIYDITKDQNESNNLSKKPSFKALQQRMKDQVLRIRRPNPSAPRRHLDNIPIPALDDVTPSVKGLAYRTFTGDWPWLPEFRDLKPAASGSFESGIDLSVLPKTSPQSGLLITGFISIPESGEWTFHSQSDSGSLLRIHEAMVIDDDFSHDESEASSTIMLEKGLHPIRLYYRSKDGRKSVFNFSWSGPNTSKGTIPAGAFSHPY